MIIFCAGMSRSGGTAQYQIVKGLVEKAGRGIGLGFAIGLPNELNQYGNHRWGVVKKEASAPWAVQMAGNKNRARAVGIHRDPRAVAASLLVWRRRQGRFQEFAEVWPEVVKAVRWYRNWTPVFDYTIAYRDAIKDWGAVALDIGHMLGLGLGAAECREVVNQWTLQRNRKRIGEQEQWLNHDTMLTREHITGAGDRWADVLTVGQVACIESSFGEWMEEHGYRRILGGASGAICRASAAIRVEPTETP